MEGKYSIELFRDGVEGAGIEKILVCHDSLTVARALYKVAALNCSERLIMLCDKARVSPHTLSCRSERSLGSLKLFEQRLRVLQVARIEPFGKPPVDRSEQFAGLLGFALVAPETRHAHRRTQFLHGRNNIDVTINDHGPYHKGRALDCTPAVDKALHLGGLGSVRVEYYPPLPKARPVEAQVATWSGTDPIDATVKPPAGYDSDRSLRPSPSNDGPQHFDQPKRMVVRLTRANSEPKKTGPLLARRPLTQHNPPLPQPFRQVTLY